MHKILLVEDDAALMRGLRDNYLDAGFDVLSAANGEDGLDLAMSEAPDLIVLDIMLPRLNGYEVCEAIRREGYDMPIIMLTAQGQEVDIIRGLNVGADDYVTKPFSVSELLARTKAFLRRHRLADTAAFDFGSCRLDRSSHQFFREGIEIVLTGKEYRLLEYFLENRGKALTRQNIMNHVWGSTILVTQRSVDRCVTTLRQKVEKNPGAPTFIKTIRDVGYRFTDTC